MAFITENLLFLPLLKYNPCGWHDQLFPRKSDKRFKNLEAISQVKYFCKQERFVCKIYLQFNYKQSLIDIHYISFTQNIYTVYKQLCTKYFFSFYR